MPITPADFEFVSNYVRDKAGIVLEPGKEYLVDARLSTLIRQEKIESITALVGRLKANSLDPLCRRVVEVMTTNETSFFRDHHPFEALKNVVLPAVIAARAHTKSLSIWCGAASSGQEPYTIAMILSEAFPQLKDWKVTFIATDISTEMLAKCRAGKYGQIEINRGLPAALMVKYFEKVGLEWQVKEPLRKMIDFRELNLTRAWSGLPPMDIVFLRNVLIYFDTNMKKEILGRVRQVLRPDGYLFLGCAETTMSIDDTYVRAPIEKTGCYRPLAPAALKAA